MRYQNSMKLSQKAGSPEGAASAVPCEPAAGGAIQVRPMLSSSGFLSRSSTRYSTKGTRAGTASPRIEATKAAASG